MHDVDDDLETVAVDAIRRASRDVFYRASCDRSLVGMGCTATIVLLNGAQAAMAHVGDSRLYLVRADGAFQLSHDQTVAAELVRDGSLTLDQAAAHPLRHTLIHAVGPRPFVGVESQLFELAGGDRLVLCSDGLGNVIPSEQWLAEQSAGCQIDELPDRLVGFALAAGGHDNVTVVAVEIELSRRRDGGILRRLAA